MRTLQPFAPNDTSIEVKADLTRTEKQIVFQFTILDPHSLVLDSLSSGSWQKWDRADNLWKTTCFEAFFGVPGSSSYWELNVSPSQLKWNLYSFENYRHPQPPRPSDDFQLSNIKANTNKIEFILKTDREIRELEFSLCAVIRTTKGAHYYSIRHAGEKADFHDRRSFLLKS